MFDRAAKKLGLDQAVFGGSQVDRTRHATIAHATHATCNIQQATCNNQCATVNSQRATVDMQQATGNIHYATGSVQRAPCRIAYPVDCSSPRRRPTRCRSALPGFPAQVERLLRNGANAFLKDSDVAEGARRGHVVMQRAYPVCCRAAAVRGRNGRVCHVSLCRTAARPGGAATWRFQVCLPRVRARCCESSIDEILMSKTRKHVSVTEGQVARTHTHTHTRAGARTLTLTRTRTRTHTQTHALTHTN